MSRWEKVRLGNYISLISGVSYSPTDVSDVATSNHIAILRAHNIQDEGLNLDNLVYVDNRKINDGQLIRKGDILVCASSGSKHLVGKAAQAKEDMEASFGAFCKIVRTDSIYAPYLGFFFRSPRYRKTISTLAAGANINNLRNEHLGDLEITLPPLEIQRKIAKTLDTVSEILAMRKQQLAELDNLIKSIFFDMFGDPVTNEKGWSIHKLGEVCDVRDGTHDSPNYVESGYPLVTSKNVRNGEISLDDVSYISYEDYCEINKRSKVDKGDIIMPMIGTIGNPAIVKHDAPSFAIKNVALIKFPIPSRIGNLYLKELLTLDFFTIITQKRSRGGTQKFIALGDIRNLEIPVPPINIQSGFENKVTIIESVKEKVTLALDEIQYLFDSLMSRYFD